MEAIKEKIVILGAGLAGLSAAHHCGGTIFEAHDHYGGTCHSPSRQGYTFDLGIHVLHTKDQYVLELLQQKLGACMTEQARRAWIYSFGTRTRYPFQANLFGLPVPVVKECLVSFIKTYCQRQTQPEIECSNYEEWINAVFGEGIARTFMIPYSEKFWTVHPRDLTTEWLDVRIPLIDIEDVIEGSLTSHDKGFGPNAMFKYPKERGIQALTDVFVQNGINVKLSHRAVHIDMHKKEITFSNGSTCRYDVLVSTIPLPILADITGLPDSLVRLPDRLKYNSILCVNIGIDHPDINPEHWIYYPEKEYSFFRISFPHNFASDLVPEGKSSISAEIAYSDKRPIDRHSIVDRVVNDLIRAGIIDREHRIEFTDVQDIRYGYVIFDHHRSETVAQLKDFYQRHHIIPAGRYGSWEYQWMDDAILDGKKAAEQARQQLLGSV